MNTLATIFGLCAVVIYILSYQMKHRRGIILCNASSGILYIIQYLLLFAFEGAAMDLLGLLPSLLAAKKDHPLIQKRLKPLIIVTNILIVAVGLLLYKNLFSLLALLGVLLEKGALWLTKERNIRIVSFLATPCWLTYNLAAGAYGSAIGNILAACSILLALIRYDFKRGEKLEASRISQNSDR